MAKKILLAEDSVTMQKVVQMTFEAEDVTVTTVATAAEALARAREMDPDVVLADLSMPGENGYDICAALKQRGGPPVLLLHGLTQSLDAERARQVGADADLAKPFESQALIDLVNDLLEKAAAAAPETHLEVKSLASPIEADVVIDGDLFGTPRSPPAPAVVAPRSPPVPAPAPAVVASPKPPVPAPTPAVVAPRSPPAPAPAPAVVAPLDPKRRGPSTVPVVPSSMASPLLPSDLPTPARGFDAPDMMRAAPAAVKSAVPIPSLSSDVADADLSVEITIDAEPPPPARKEVLPSFGKPMASLPLPPPGMSVPSLPLPPRGMAIPEAAPIPEALSRKVAGVVSDRAPSAVLSSLDPAVVAAITALTREVVEQIVWEVVPQLAEVLIKEELERVIASRDK